MDLKKSTAKTLFPDKDFEDVRLGEITHLGIGAHQDDLEVMAGHGIIACYEKSDLWFGGVTCTDGSGSSRAGKFADFTDSQMADVRVAEQESAARVGKFGFVAQLGYTSSEVKKLVNEDLKNDFKKLISATKPKVIYTHSLFDKHPTHVAVVITLIDALKDLKYVPEKLLGCEVWRGLDWMDDKDKVALDLTGHEKFIQKLIQLFESQVEGGKRYDLATLGRVRSNATFFESHATDRYESLLFAVDMTELVVNSKSSLDKFVKKHLDKFAASVKGNVNQ